MTPQELVAAAQRGDHDAFAELWRLYRADVQRFAYARVRDQHVAEDITSETFLRAWKGIGSFTWQGKGFGGWVITIAAHLCFDHFKSSHQQRSWAYDFNHEDAWQHPSRDRRTHPEQVAEHADLAAVLDRALAQLTPDQRRCLALRFGAELRLAETAERMDRRMEAVKAVQHRATVALLRDPDVAALAVAA